MQSSAILQLNIEENNTYLGRGSKKIKEIHTKKIIVVFVIVVVVFIGVIIIIILIIILIIIIIIIIINITIIINIIIIIRTEVSIPNCSESDENPDLKAQPTKLS